MGLRINGDAVVIASGGAQDTTTAYVWEIEGSDSAEYRLTELDQADPKGRWRLRAAGNQLLFESAALARWGRATAYITFDQATNKVRFGQHLVASSGKDVGDELQTLADRIDEMAEHIRYIVLILANLGLELPQNLADLLNDLVWHPSELVYGPATT
jgi:hypothetical protein